MAITRKRTAIRICPYYRLPQVGRNAAADGGCSPPSCTALRNPAPLGPDVAARLCRSGAFRTCERYQRARSSEHRQWTDSRELTLTRRLLTSALWVLGIPTAITLAILVAAWITEKVWVPTEQLIIQLTGLPWL